MGLTLNPLYFQASCASKSESKPDFVGEKTRSRKLKYFSKGEGEEVKSEEEDHFLKKIAQIIGVM